MPKQIARQIVIAIVTIIAPALYTLIANIAPGIPISGEQFLAFIIWLVSGIIGGGAIAMASNNFMTSMPADFSTTSNKTWAFIIPAVVYAALIITALVLAFKP